MKRKSIAEITLDKQVKSINNQLEAIEDKIKALQTEYYSVQKIRDQLEQESLTLFKARERASERNTK